jgi:hypothetical protein
MLSDLRWGGAVMSALVLLSTVTPGNAAERSPTPEEQARFIASTREAALAYSSRLPDFICTQTVKRSLDRGRGMWPLDTLTFETSYYHHRETNKLTHRNGSPASDSIGSPGLLSRGEFGDNLLRIFVPESQAQFRFKKWTSLRGRRAAVYSYRVDRSKEPWLLSTTAGGQPRATSVGLRGDLTIDAMDFSILRVEYIADNIPRDFPMRSAKITVDYENAEIGGKQYLLPARAEGLARSVSAAKNESVFRNYRKFSADTVIEFGEPLPPQP